MASNADKIDRWVAEVRKDAPRYLGAHTYSGTVQIHSARAAKRARLYSYGTHYIDSRIIDTLSRYIVTGQYKILDILTEDLFCCVRKVDSGQIGIRRELSSGIR